VPAINVPRIISPRFGEGVAFFHFPQPDIQGVRSRQPSASHRWSAPPCRAIMMRTNGIWIDFDQPSTKTTRRSRTSTIAPRRKPSPAPSRANRRPQPSPRRRTRSSTPSPLAEREDPQVEVNPAKKVVRARFGGGSKSWDFDGWSIRSESESPLSPGALPGTFRS
jgi:hypothetical protein